MNTNQQDNNFGHNFYEPSTSNANLDDIEISGFDMTFCESNSSITNYGNQNSNNFLPPPVRRNDEYTMRAPLMQKSEKSKVSILTGNIAQILKWNQALQEFQLFQTIGVYASDWDSGNDYLRVLLVRQPRGPVLKVKIVPNRYPEVPKCIPGQFLRIIGRIIDKNLMVAYKISSATEVDYQRLERAAQFCERIVRHRTS